MNETRDDLSEEEEEEGGGRGLVVGEQKLSKDATKCIFHACHTTKTIISSENHNKQLIPWNHNGTKHRRCSDYQRLFYRYKQLNNFFRAIWCPMRQTPSIRYQD